MTFSAFKITLDGPAHACPPSHGFPKPHGPRWGGIGAALR